MSREFQEKIPHTKKLNEELFEQLFFELYTPLTRFSLKFVIVPEIAEEIVQDVFTYLWEKRFSIRIKVSYSAYLYSSVKNKSIDYLKSKYGRLSLVEEEILYNKSAGPNPDLILEGKELEHYISAALKELPLGCYNIFALSRFAGLNNKQIAKELNISVKTVENQMTKALRKTKEFLEKHWDTFSIVVLTLLS